MAYNHKDHFYMEAKRRNYAARSIFKLEEIDQKFRLLKQGHKVLDLGCAPGSWAQYASARVGAKGSVIGIDLQEVRLSLTNVRFIKGDILEWQPGLDEGPFDAVLSDMAPKTTGILITDQARSLELCEMALGIAQKFLKPGGHFVCKLFNSAEFGGLRNKIRAQFSKVEILRPEATRAHSKEVFLVGISRSHKN